MDTIVSGFATVGKGFSYVGLVVGLIVGIGLIFGGSMELENKNDKVQSSKAGLILIIAGFVIISVGMLNTYFVSKSPAYASVVGFSDVLSLSRSHPLFGLI